MNRKGFTLIEIIAVIAILATISIVVTVNMTKTMKKYTENDCENFKEEVEEAACTYADIKFDDNNDGIKEPFCDRSKNSFTASNPCIITIEQLYSYGLINDEVNKCNGKKIKEDTTHNIKVYWTSDGTKICKYEG